MHTRFSPEVEGKTVNDVVSPMILDPKIGVLLKEMGINIYNTLSRKKEKLESIHDKQLLLYTCGPTVYNYAHIGNLRSYIFPDLLKRVARYSGYNIKQIMNFTDVGHLTDDGDHGEDKMQKAVERENKTSRDIAAFYEENFISDLNKLNITLPTEFVKATDLIQEQIDIVVDLEKKGYVYKIESDGMYMDTSKVADYGKLVGKKHIEGLQSSARIEDVGKKNITDFALWKFNVTGKKRDMERDSPRGIGFPGWHIECSAIAINKLGKTIDVHTGGVDHIPIHHTNEIAQSECYTGEKFSNYWMHGEFLNMEDDKKMSKSSGDFLHLHKLEELGYSPLAFKYLTYLTHYRKGMKFSLDILEQAKISYVNIKNRIQTKIKSGDISNEGKRNYYYDKIFSSLLDDLNMPMALSHFQTMLKDNEIGSADVELLTKEFDKIAGLDLLVTESTDIPSEVRDMAEQRKIAKQNKDRTESDRIRDEIIKLGFTIKDTKEGYGIVKI